LKKIALISVLAFITGTLLTGCGYDTAEEGGGSGFGQMRGQATSVEVLEVQQSSISDQIRSFGTIRSQAIVDLNPQVSNRVTAIYADLGDSVRTGDRLAKIYELPFRDAYEQAQAQNRQSRVAFLRDSIQYSRQEQLFDSGAISSLEFDQARATYNTARAQMEASQASLTNTREDLENTVLRSPVNGVILSREIDEGDIATTGTVAFTIANLVGYETRLFLPMADWNAISVGLPVELQLSNSRQSIARGVISRISPQLNPETGLGEVVVSLVEVTPMVRQGVLAESRITLETRENTVVIPRTSMIENVETFIEPETNTVELRRNYSVYVAQGDTIAVRQNLTLGLEQGERVEILEGLAEGQKIIVTGQSGLRDGARIRIAGQETPSQERGGTIDVMEPADGAVSEDGRQARRDSTARGGGQGRGNRSGGQSNGNE
jgi:RND family efflux transporter MFP subunit